MPHLTLPVSKTVPPPRRVLGHHSMKEVSGLWSTEHSKLYGLSPNPLVHDSIGLRRMPPPSVIQMGGLLLAFSAIPTRIRSIELID